MSSNFLEPVQCTCNCNCEQHRSILTPGLTVTVSSSYSEIYLTKRSSFFRDNTSIWKTVRVSQEHGDRKADGAQKTPVNLKRDVELWLDSTQLSEDGKQSYHGGNAVPHRSTVNELTNHLNTTTAAAKKVKVRIALCGLKTYHRATERHLPYGITQCYLPPDTGERAPP